MATGRKKTNRQYRCGRVQPDTRNLQISTDLETIKYSKKESANLNKFVSGQRISYGTKPITHGINDTLMTALNPTPPR
jgi:hypothetical protein